MLTPQTVLQGRYRIIRQLGQGGMGAVYEAVDERLDTTVALKETLFTDERLRKQFEREARLLARMHHPALPRVSDHFSESDGQFLVMQFIAGEDLGEMMKEKQGPFPVEQVLLWGDQLLDALDYLHTQEPQIVHRDIKPQNLKLTSRGQIILLDFGLAKGQTAGVSVVTTASIFGYTPNYAPLEQIQGLGTDPRSDIYALSATLYHLMTGGKPPDALTRAAALVNGEKDPLQPANEVNGAINARVAAVLARGMSQGREQRFVSASAMRAAMKGEDGTQSAGDRTEAATVIFPGSSAATAVTELQSPPTAALGGETTVVQTTPKRSGLRPWALVVAAVVLIGVGFGVFYAIQNRNGTTAVSTPTPSPSPASTPADVAADPNPAAGGSADEAALENSTEATIKKNEKVVKDTKPAPVDRVVVTEKPKPSPPLIGNPTWNEPKPPETPDTGPADNSLFPRRPGIRVRNLPDGSRIIINPDGTRVMIMADGTRRVLPPAPRQRRKY
ncbi:MAG TPA: protein kinase [Pyrinomonadaceae bacterium]